MKLSDNLTENSMRGEALGRNDCVPTGVQNAGRRETVIPGIAETGPRLGLAVYEYLLGVQPGISGRKRTEVAGLAPTAG